MNHFTGKYVKRKGQLEMVGLTRSKQYEVFVSNLEEGQMVDCFYEAQQDDGTIPQLAKLHVMIKHLAAHLGYPVEDMKLLVKDKAGLCLARELSGKEYFLAKSFAECSREELSLAITAAIQIGEEVNFLVG